MSVKMHLFFYNNVDFAREYIPLYPNIRLLERDGWILLDKDHEAYWHKK